MKKKKKKKTKLTLKSLLRMCIRKLSQSLYLRSKTHLVPRWLKKYRKSNRTLIDDGDEPGCLNSRSFATGWILYLVHSSELSSKIYYLPIPWSWAADKTVDIYWAMVLTFSTWEKTKPRLDLHFLTKHHGTWILNSQKTAMFSV